MLAEKVRSLCKERGITIRELEHVLGIGNGTIRKWSKSSPRVKTVERIANYFGVSVDELLKKEE